MVDMTCVASKANDVDFSKNKSNSIWRLVHCLKIGTLSLNVNFLYKKLADVSICDLTF